jgi:signal transduction histidine kinase
MTVHGWISIVAAVAALALALIAIFHGRPNALKSPFALLCLDVSAWTAANPAFLAYPGLALGIDRTLSPLTAPLALDFVLVFVGSRRSSSVTRTALFVLCGSLSLTSLVALLVRGWHPFLDSRLWQVWLLASALPTMAVAAFALGRHWHQSVNADERGRASFLLLALGTGTMLGLSDSIKRFAPMCPQLSEVGMLVGAIGMAIVTFRFRLFGREPSWRVLIALGVAAVAALCACALALSMAGTRPVTIVMVVMAIAVAGAAAAHERVTAAAMRAERKERMATLGRFSAQMDHDVRNPLAALKGAAQLLRRDLARPEPLINRVDFANLIVDQVERVETIFSRYRRLSRLELDRALIDVNEVVCTVLARQAPGFPEGIVVERDLAPALPPCLADADLLATMIENLARNAVEAMPQGGALTVRTRASSGAPPRVELSLEDTGVGMDARTRERATDDFFTTKEAGTGFGLAFTKRVAQAHGGNLTIASKLGAGTQVRLWIPVSPS